MPRRRIIAVLLGGSLASAAALISSCADTPVAQQQPPPEPPGCTEGTLGCACAQGSCTGGECVSGTCTDCERGAHGCVCFENSTCNAGERCAASGLCETCPPGEKGCACPASGACSGQLDCDSSVCVQLPCPRGAVGCACDPGSKCDGTLTCTGGNLCAECSADIVGCPCDAQGACSNDLVCETADNTCREARKCLAAGCLPGQACEELAGIDARCLSSCVADYEWNPVSQRCTLLATQSCTAGDEDYIGDWCAALKRPCVVQAGGADCTGCLGGFTEGGANGACRAVQECLDLTCDTQNRLCVAAGTHADAVCGACQNGFVEAAGQCVVPNCTPGAPGSLAAQCADQHRVCDDPVSGPPACGACVDGYTEQSGSCVEVRTCESLGCAGRNRLCEGAAPNQSCGACVEGTAQDPADSNRCIAPQTCEQLDCFAKGQFCIVGTGAQGARCEAAQCPLGQASRSSGTADCVDCYVTCDDLTATTGRTWPYVANTGRCICETRADYFWNESARRSSRCDNDGDGWVQLSARTSIEGGDGEAIRQNARCALRQADRIVLENEWGQEETVLLCSGNTPFQRGSDQCAGTSSAAPFKLYESVALDVQSELEGREPATLTPLYGGRKLKVAEVNPFTKACVSDGGDYNDNLIEDVKEHQEQTDSVKLNTWEKQVASAFSHFLELHRAWWEPRGDSVLMGQYRIQERSRCDLPGGSAEPFPLGYGPAVTSTYWRECVRSRDVAYNPALASPVKGLDFARWSCSETSGPCAIPPPVADLVAAQAGEIPLHGLCELRASGLSTPAVPWRGMTHHSQFRCVQNGAAMPFTQTYAFNQCRACTSGATGCDAGESETFGLTGTRSAPRLVCQVTSGATGWGFAAIRFDDAGIGYSRGCIDEWNPNGVTGDSVTTDPVAGAWRALCPGWTERPEAVTGAAHPQEFGALRCGCTANMGGLACELGCPQEDRLLQDPYGMAPRTGLWLCGRLSTTEGTMVSPGTGSAPTWELTGEFDASPGPSEKLSGGVWELQ